MLATYPVMEALRVSGRELRFDRLAGKVFSRSADDHGVATVEIGRDGVGEVRGGRHGLMLLKTSGSAFTHFARDEYTTLPERGDRPLFIRIDVDWRYAPGARARRLARRARPPRARRSTTSSRSRSSTSSTRWARGCWPTTSSSPRSRFTAENHTRDPVGEEDGRRVYTDPFPAQGLITLTLDAMSLTTHVLDTARGRPGGGRGDRAAARRTS